MAIAFAVASALLVGSGDFFGGIAGRRGPLMAVALWVQIVGVVAATALSFAIGGDPTAADLRWGAAAGVAGALGVLALYRGFAVSRMGVVAPVSAIVAAGAPVLFGLAEGERPGPWALLGLGAGIAAIALISRQPAGGRGGDVGPGVLYGFLTGIGFGALFILLSRTETGSGMWPIVPARLAGTVMMLVVAMLWRRPVVPVRAARAPLVLSSTLGTVGNGLFLLAAQRGLLSVVAVITSMYPAATVAWARAVLGERLHPARWAGVVLALVAVALIVAG